MNYLRVENINELDEKLLDLWETDGPCICEIIGKEDQNYIELSHAKSNISGKFVRRPLEDQKPFLDREFLKKEMIIEPIDL